MPFALEPCPGNLDEWRSPTRTHSAPWCPQDGRLPTHVATLIEWQLLSPQSMPDTWWVSCSTPPGILIIPRRPLLKAQPLPSLVRRSHHWEGKWFSQIPPDRDPWVKIPSKGLTSESELSAPSPPFPLKTPHSFLHPYSRPPEPLLSPPPLLYSGDRYPMSIKYSLWSTFPSRSIHKI